MKNENNLRPANITSEGTSFKLGNKVKQLMFTELGKVSNKEEIHAYMSGIAELDHSRLFNKRDAINAANWTKEMCTHGKHCKHGKRTTQGTPYRKLTFLVRK